MAQDYKLTLNQVDWLGNAPMLIGIPFSFLVPELYSRWGLRKCVSQKTSCVSTLTNIYLFPCSQCYLGSLFLGLSAWSRYAGTADGLSSKGAYALFMLGQVCFFLSPRFATNLDFRLWSRSPTHSSKSSDRCTPKHGSISKVAQPRRPSSLSVSEFA